MINSPRREMLGPRSFGHDGAGGQLGFAHLELEIGFGYRPSDLEASGTNAPRPCAALSAPASNHPSQAIRHLRNDRHHLIEERDNMPVVPSLAPMLSDLPLMPEGIDDFHAYRTEAGEGADAVAEQLAKPAPEGAERAKVRIPAQHPGMVGDEGGDVPHRPALAQRRVVPLLLAELASRSAVPVRWSSTARPLPERS
jgi:hypothetical protein